MVGKLISDSIVMMIVVVRVVWGRCVRSGVRKSVVSVMLIVVNVLVVGVVVLVLKLIIECVNLLVIG